MSKPERMTRDEVRAHKKTMLRARKAIEAIEAEMRATHFRCWEMELRYPELYPAADDDGPPGEPRPMATDDDPRWN
ncbi:MAG: hypothetical protein WB297_14975 [Actinomycetota bacterium]